MTPDYNQNKRIGDLEVQVIELRALVEQQRNHIIHLNNKLKASYTYKSYGCLNRNGLEEAIAGLDLTDKAVVYFDLDSLTQLNFERGKAMVNNQVWSSLLHTRSTDFIFNITALIFSGDEFVSIVNRSDALGFAKRIQNNFRSFGMSATFAIVDIEGFSTVYEAMQYCDEVVKSFKIADQRDLIVVTSDVFGVCRRNVYRSWFME